MKPIARLHSPATKTSSSSRSRRPVRRRAVSAIVLEYPSSSTRWLDEAASSATTARIFMLPRQLRNPPRRPRRAECVHLFLYVCQINFDQLVQTLEERASLLLRDRQRVTMRCCWRGG